jgi:hypothetical protein
MRAKACFQIAVVFALAAVGVAAYSCATASLSDSRLDAVRGGCAGECYASTAAPTAALTWIPACDLNAHPETAIRSAIRYLKPGIAGLAPVMR